jgi:translation initiation factor 3 subunit A
VYDSVKLARVVKLATFKDDKDNAGRVAQVRIEKFITDACRRGELAVRLDHVEGIIEFEDKPFQDGGADDDVALTSSDVDTLQPTPASLLRTHLTRLAQTLYTSLDTISPNTSALALTKGRAEAALQALAQNMEKEREAILSRRLISEQRKQKAEAEALKKEKEAESARVAARQEQAVREAKRVEQEAKARQLEMIRKNNEAVKAEEARKLADKLRSAGALKVVPKDIESLDTAALMKIQVEKIEKDKKDLAEKLRIIGKRIDHTERAFRKEEIPLLHKDYDIQQQRDREIYESTRKARVEEARAAHAFNLKIKNRLGSIMPDYEAFREKKLSAVQEEYEKRVKQAEKKIAEEKAKRKSEVESRREAEKAQRQREEEASRRAEEEERARAEEEERRAAEEAAEREAEEARLAEEKQKAEEESAKKRAEEMERRSRLDDVARKQRERDEEIERKLREKESAKKEQVARIPGAAGWRREGAPPTAVAANATNEAAAGERPKLNLAPRSEATGASWRDRQAAAKPQEPAAASPPISRGGTPQPTGERRRLQLAPRTASESAPAPTQAAVAPANGTSAPAPAVGASWREREAARQAAGSPAGKEDDGFQPVKKPTTGGAYRPPGVSNLFKC